MKKLMYLMLIICLAFTPLATLVACSNNPGISNEPETKEPETKELETSEYSAILIASFDYVFKEAVFYNPSSRENEGYMQILDVSRFDEGDIGSFIEYVNNKFKEYPDTYLLITKSNEENALRELPSDTQGTIFEFYFSTGDAEERIRYTSSSATVLCNVSFLYNEGGYGFNLELEKSGETWEVVNYMNTWIS